jgi:hypothetical protein
MNESAISIFRKLPETKSQIAKYKSLIRDSVLNGEVNPLEFAAQVSALEQLFKGLKADHLIKDCILEEAEKYGAKSFEHGNAKFTIKEAGVKWDFSNCDDFELVSINDAIAELTAKKESRETILKAIIPGTEIFGSDGIQLNPAIKTSTTIVSILLK